MVCEGLTVYCKDFVITEGVVITVYFNDLVIADTETLTAYCKDFVIEGDVILTGTDIRYEADEGRITFGCVETVAPVTLPTLPPTISTPFRIIGK